MVGAATVPPGRSKSALPPWTWVLPLFVFHLGTQLSLHVSIAPGISLWYLPVPLGIALVHWWGPRVLPAVYLNALLSAGLWGLPRWELWALYAWPETCAVFLSWLLATRGGRRSVDLGNTRGTLDFLFLGIAVPILIGSGVVPVQLWLLGDLKGIEVARSALAGMAGDFITSLSITLPLLIFATRWLHDKGWSRMSASVLEPFYGSDPESRSDRALAFAGLCIALIALAGLWPIHQAWWLFGLGTVTVALFMGTKPAITANTVVIAATFLAPGLWNADTLDLDTGFNLARLNLGFAVLCLTSILTARMTDDLRMEIRRREAAETALRMSERRHRNIVEALPDLYFRIDKDGVFLDYHASNPRDLLASPSEFMGKPLLEVMPPEIGEQNMICLRMALESGETTSFEYSLVLGGRKKLYESRIVPEGSEEAMVFVRDITRERHTEEALIRTQKLESLGQLAGGIAHDFNNLLGGLFGFIDLARGHMQRGDIQTAEADFTKMGQVYARAKGLTHQLLTFSKGGLPVKRNGDLQTVVKQAFEFALAGSNCLVEYQQDNVPLICEFDADQLSRVFENLAINARQAMPEGGRVLVAFSKTWVSKGSHPNLAPGEYFKVLVRDRGPGIPDANLPKIFDPFFSTKKDGSGLGLATSLSIVKKHLGTIEVESQEGDGAIFSVYIPVGDPQEHSSPDAEKTLSPSPTKILVMDDEQWICDVTREMLASVGHDVTCVPGGDEALESLRRAAAESRPFAIAILDLTVPGGMGGKELALKMGPEGLGTILMASSGYSDDPIISRPEDYGFAGSIRKPYRLEELMQAIADAQSSASQGARTLLLVDDDNLLQDLYRTILIKAGFRLLQARLGTEAVEIYRKHKQEIDLVLIDRNLPGMDGPEVFEKLKQLHSGLRALFLSGNPSREGMEEVLSDPCCLGLLEKPHTRATVLDCVRAHLPAKP